MGARFGSRQGIATITAVTALTLGTSLLGASTAFGQDDGPAGKDRNVEARARTTAAQLVTVAAPSRTARARVAALGLDVTEAASAAGIDVVLHSDADRDVLRRAGFTWKVKVKDLDALRRANAVRDRDYAAKRGGSPLPSGQDHYRTLADYNREMRAMAVAHPGMVRMFALKHRSLQGRKVYGIEVTRNVHRTNDGKPVFLMLGSHHAREWPSSEHTIEFAYDLLKHYGGHSRATRIVNEGRTIFVPVVNVDGFDISRSAPPLGDFSLFDYEMKRKNCRVSDSTPAQYTGGTCADNPAGRLRGTDLNRNYPGFWGGPGASTNWSDDTFRGDSPGSEPEVDNIRSLISSRQVTALVTNHTYSDLVLRPPSLYSTGLSPDEAQYEALGAMMTDANHYANWPAYRLYDTSGSTEDWSYWNTGGFGFTFEIGDEGFHPAYQDAVVGEYLGLPPAAGAGHGGNREAYYRLAMANLRPAYHSTITGKAPANRRLTIRKQFTSHTSPVIVDDAQPNVTTDPIEYHDVLRSSLDTKGGRFRWSVNPSTRPVVAGRSGREAQGPAQPAIDLSNPAGVPAVGDSEYTTFDVKGLPDYDNGAAFVTVSWPGVPGDEALDWDVFVYNSDGEIVGQSASLADPEVAVLVDPVPGEYTVEVNNYQGGTADHDWTGRVTFEQPKPPIVTGIKEAWMLTCRKPDGDVVSTRKVVVDRGHTARIGNACARHKP
jgi:Zinc carboxypeptidase